MLNSFFKKQSKTNLSDSIHLEGFTLLETLTVVIIVGILAAVVAPSWLGFLQRQRLNEAQGEIYQAMQQAQRRAKQENTSWQASFRETTVDGKTVVQWRTEDEIDTDSDPFLNNVTGGWKSLDSRINVDQANTTMEDNGNATWRTQFDYQGRAMGDTGIYNGKITLSAENIDAKRCVIVSTILGSMREAKDEECE